MFVGSCSLVCLCLYLSSGELNTKFIRKIMSWKGSRNWRCPWEESMRKGRSRREEGPEVWVVKIRPAVPSRPLGGVRRCCGCLLGFDNRVHVWVAPAGERGPWNPLKMGKGAKPAGVFWDPAYISAVAPSAAIGFPKPQFPVCKRGVIAVRPTGVLEGSTR